MASINGKVFWVEQGFYSPRDKTVGWRFWGQYGDQKEANKQAKKLGMSRVLEVKEVKLVLPEGIAIE